ncbi:ribonuclease T2 [Arvicola amphibius]|uniref:ribonuclease T2 n=1 Tax=Arvicola amphibius TaxID=1047088 RepID=UPI0018E31AC8|nr:ribonuclease T2 [Arvicola amphibius]
MASAGARGAFPGWVSVLAWGLALWCLCGAGPLWSGNHEWKKLILTQHWPPTVCKEVDGCRDTLDYWTIHGLWPDRAEDCNQSWHFNLDEIKDLLGDMKIYWPDVIHPSSNRSRFWKHEWDKHGTCAAQVDALNSEKKYFGKSLDLYKQIDLNSVLLKFGIKPSINYYQLADFRDALTRIYGVVPKIQCLVPEQGESVQTVGQIELCFTKEDLHLRNCTEPDERLSFRQDAWLAAGASTHGMMVCEDGPIFYPPPAKTQL